MASYILIGSSSIVQVLGPQVAEEAVVATIQTIPTGIVAAKPISQAAFDDGTGAADLEGFADAIEAAIAHGKAVGGTGTSQLDANGLQQYYVTFEVAYNPPGAPQGTVTTDVDVPVGLLTAPANMPGVLRRRNANDLINAAYNSLVALSGGTPAAPAAAVTPAAPADGSSPSG